MQLTDSSTKTGLVEDVDFWASTDSTSYPLADKVRNINRHYYVAVTDILRASGRYQYDDSNLATLPKVDLTMVSGTHEVALPEANIKINAIEIKDASGNYYRIPEIDFADKLRSISSFTTSSGMPLAYDVIGGYIYLDPAPLTGSVTLTSGLRVWVEREIDAFTTSDTTQEPGFAEPFHRLLSLGAAYDYLIVNGPSDKADRVLQLYMGMREDLRTFYADKNEDAPVRFRPAHNTGLYL